MSNANAGTLDAVSFGGSAAAIRHHYDVGNDFYRLWLDESLTYSAAFWSDDQTQTLAEAQRAKLDFHLDNVALPAGGRLLDIGCGWGGILSRALERQNLGAAVGLTLSEEQARHVTALGSDKLSVALESWTDHQPGAKYDGIISIGAFEHFADPRQDAAGRLAVYRAFFERCREWLTPDGALSLQTIVYGDMAASQANGFIANEIFPAAELPRPAEIFTAADRIFEVVTYHNRRIDYARTCEAWAANLRRNREAAVAVAGEATVSRYERYLRLSAAGFRLGRIGLARLKLTPYPAGRVLT
jgi:cyclopropane-fatty-acyl-phospholipid synthase